MKPGKHQMRNQRYQDWCWKVHDRAESFVVSHTLCVNFVTKTFLLVSSSCFMHGQGQESKQNHTTKIFFEFYFIAILRYHLGNFKSGFLEKGKVGKQCFVWNFNVLLHVSFLLFCSTEYPKYTEMSNMNEINIYKIFIKLKEVKTSKITSSQTRLVF